MFVVSAQMFPTVFRCRESTSLLNNKQRSLTWAQTLILSALSDISTFKKVKCLKVISELSCWCSFLQKVRLCTQLGL